MKNNSLTWDKNAVIIFWLGILTAAVVIGFAFLFRVLNRLDAQDALLKYSFSSTSLYDSTKLGTTSIGTPQL